MATSDSPRGPFDDALGEPLIATAQFGGQSIDPYPFIDDDDGQAYLCFGSTSAGGHVVKLNEDMISLKSTPQQIVIGGFKEGSVMFKREGIYYFMWSEGDTRSPDYDVAYGTGSSPLGPFQKAAGIVPVVPTPQECLQQAWQPRATLQGVPPRKDTAAKAPASARG